MADESLKRVAQMLETIKKGKKESEVQIEKERRNLVLGVGKDIVQAISPVLNQIVQESRTTKTDFERAIKAIKIQNNVPSVNVPEIIVPTPRVTVQPPAINIPDVVMPDEMNVKGWVQLMGVDLGNPLPVQLRDASGKPVNLLENLTTLVSGSGGGIAKIVKVSGIEKTVGFVNIDPDGNPTYAGATSGLTDTELRASSVPVSQASDVLYSVQVKQIWGSTVTTLLNGDNRIPVSVETGGSGLTDNELRAAHLDVKQLSGTVYSTIVNSGTITAVTGITNSVTVSALPETIQTQLADIETSVQLLDDAISGSEMQVDVVASLPAGTNNIGDVDIASSLPAGTNAIGKLSANSGVDIGDVDVLSLPASTNTIEVVGDAAHDSAVAGNPVLMGGEARTSNPTAVSNGDAVRSIHDDIGRKIIRNIQVRDLLQTAYVTEDEVQEATLLTGASGIYHDLVYLMASNESDGAITLDIRQTTGGTVQSSIAVPANATAGMSLTVPVPRDHSNASWTVQNNASDNSNTVYSVTALFSKEV